MRRRHCLSHPPPLLSAEEPYFNPYDPAYNFEFAPEEAPQGLDALFSGLERAPRSSDPGSDVEAERLRAALHGTPGAGDYKDAMFQLGLTPASEDPNRPGSRHNKRFSGALRRDSTRGRLSER